jgi:hypothetical protein
MHMKSPFIEHVKNLVSSDVERPLPLRSQAFISSLWTEVIEDVHHLHHSSTAVV